MSNLQLRKLKIWGVAAALAAGFVVVLLIEHAEATKNSGPIQPYISQAAAVSIAPQNSQSQKIDNSAALAKGVPVFMYHHIGDLPPKADQTRRDLTVSAADFSAQMDYLSKQGYHSITTAQLYAATQNKFALPPKPMVLSFDDGYKDTFANAVPILLQHHMVGVFGIITLYPGFPDYASWDTIASAKANGMEIIPHTQTHIDLSNKKYSHADREREIGDSIKDIQQHLGKTPVAFIYPYGHYNDDAIAIAKEHGIQIAFTVKLGLFRTSSDLLTEPRVRVHGVEDIKKFEILLEMAQSKSPSPSVVQRP